MRTTRSFRKSRASIKSPLRLLLPEIDARDCIIERRKHQVPDEGLLVTFASKEDRARERKREREREISEEQINRQSQNVIN